MTATLARTVKCTNSKHAGHGAVISRAYFLEVEMKNFEKCVCPDGRKGVYDVTKCGMYYVPGDENGFQWHRGQKIAATSYNAFGEDAYWAERDYKCWLERAQQACKEFGL